MFQDISAPVAPCAARASRAKGTTHGFFQPLGGAHGMRLRADVGEVEEALAEWWQDFQAADDERRDDLMDQAKEEQRARQKAQQPVVKRVPRNASAAAPRAAAPAERADFQEEGAEFAAEGNAPKKRRRRRRKPGGGAGGEGAAPAAAGE